MITLKEQLMILVGDWVQLVNTNGEYITSAYITCKESIPKQFEKYLNKEVAMVETQSSVDCEQYLMIVVI